MIKGMRDETTAIKLTAVPAVVSSLTVSSLIPVFILVSSLISYPSSLAHAAFNTKSAGTSGASFLKLGGAGRPVAMGEAYTAVADDLNAVYYNTAGLASISRNEFIGMRADLFQDLQYNFFALAHPTKSWGTFAVGLNNLSISGIEQRTTDSDKPDSTFSSNDTAYTLGYGYRLTMGKLDGLNLGLGFKYIRQTLSGETASSFAFDLGSLYQFADLPLSVGLAVQNLGTKIKFKNESDALPLTIRTGTSYRLGEDWQISGPRSEEGGAKGGCLFALDFNAPRDNDVYLGAGSEFTRRWSEEIVTSIRAGYQTGKSRQFGGTGSGVSAGCGIGYKFFSFDFAWMPFGSLGNTFRYSVRLRF